MTYPTRLSLSNCGPYRGKQSIDLNRINYIVGDSGSGKSWLRDVMEWAITGTSPRFTNAAGSFQAGVKLNGDPTDSATVAVEFAGDHQWRVIRSVTPGGNVTLKVEDMVADKWSNASTTKAKGAVQQMVYERTVPEAAWKVLFDAGRFAALAPADRTAALNAICAERLTVEQIGAEVAKLGSLAIGEWKLLERPADFDFSLNRLVEARRLANANVKTLKVALDSMKLREPKGTATVADLRARVAELEAEFKAAVAAEATAESRESELARLKARRDVLLQGPKLKDLNDAAEQADAEAKSAAEEWANRPHLPENPESELRLWDKTYQAIVSGKFGCPVTGGECGSLTAEQVDTKRKDALTRCETYRAAVQAEATLKTRLDAATQALAKATTAVHDKQAAGVELNNIARELTALESPADECRPSDDVKAELETVRAELAEHETYDREVEQQKRLKPDLAKAEAKAAALDSLVKDYDVDGIRKRLRGPSQFADVVRNGVEYFLRGKIDLQAGVLISDKGSIPLTMLSRGEAQRLGAAIQFGIGTDFGLWFLTFDEFGGALGVDDRERIRKQIEIAFKWAGGGCALMFGQIPDSVVAARRQVAKLKDEGKPAGWTDEQYAEQLKRDTEKADLGKLYRSVEISVFETTWSIEDGSKTEKK